MPLSLTLKQSLLLLAALLAGTLSARAGAPAQAVPASAYTVPTEPVIAEIPNPVLGNAESAPGPNQFVFPDAINLNSFAASLTTDSACLRWSYEVVGEPIYSINGVPPLDRSKDDPNNPGAKQINNQVLNNEQDRDNNPATITIRNVKISPLNPVTSDTVPTSPNDPRAASQVLTLICSDGASYTEKNIICYTDIGGADRMSPGSHLWPPDPDPIPDYKHWTHSTYANVTFTTTSASLCMEVAAQGINVGQWDSPLGVFEILNDQVYHIRATVVGSQATPGHTPFWDMTISNPTVVNPIGADKPFSGFNAYGCDAYFFDNRGGANAATTTPRDFHLWWAPSAVATPQWQAGAFTAAMSPEMKSRIIFRVLDADNCPAINADNAWGTLCLKNLTIERYPLSALQKINPNDKPVYSVTSFKPADETGTGNVSVQAFGKTAAGATVDYTGGALTITPSIKGEKQVELIGIYPAADLHLPSDPATTPNQIADDYPITWESDSLYQITVDLQAKDTNGEANPPDAFFIQVDEPTNELNYLSMITTGGDMVGMPKVGTGPQTYMAFFYSHQATKDTTLNYNRWRPSLQFASNQFLTYGDNSGAFKISKWEVNKVRFQ